MKLHDLFESQFLTYGERYPDTRQVTNRSVNCSGAQLISLKGSPRKVVGGFNCSSNRLTNLEGAPAEVYGIFECSYNELTTFKGGPQHADYFVCNGNKARLTSVEGLPAEIRGNLHLVNCHVESLHNIHKYVKAIRGGEADFGRSTEAVTPPPTHVLGLLLIAGLTNVNFMLQNKKGIRRRDVGVQLTEIINKHLKGDRDVLACQQDLLDAGLDEYAQL